MAWYWYLAGVHTTLFVLSLLLNVGLATGFVKYNRSKPARITRLYDQDNSGEYRRSA